MAVEQVLLGPEWEVLELAPQYGSHGRLCSVLSKGQSLLPMREYGKEEGQKGGVSDHEVKGMPCFKAHWPI